MAKVTLRYQDADNYKREWDVTIPDETMRNLGEPDFDDCYEIARLGLSLHDIPLIHEYGYDEYSDYSGVSIVTVAYEE